MAEKPHPTRRWLVVVAILSVVCVALFAMWAVIGRGIRRQLYLTLYYLEPGPPCAVLYSDENRNRRYDSASEELRLWHLPGAQVRVEDEDGNILVEGSLHRCRIPAEAEGQRIIVSLSLSSGVVSSPPIQEIDVTSLREYNPPYFGVWRFEGQREKVR